MSVEEAEFDEMFQCSVVVLVCAKPHVSLVKRFVQAGIHVVSISDGLGDTMKLLQLHEESRRNNSTLIVDAAASPGLTGLLIHRAILNFYSIDEAHIALH